MIMTDEYSDLSRLDSHIKEKKVHSDAMLFDYTPKGKKPKGVDELFKKSEDKTTSVPKTKIQLLTEKRNTLLMKSKERKQTGELKKEIRHLQTERFEPLLGGAKKTLGIIRGKQSAIGHGARRVSHSTGSHNIGFSGNGLDLSLSKSNVGKTMSRGVKIKKEHYLEF
jgi:hypothetical protein